MFCQHCGNELKNGHSTSNGHSVTKAAKRQVRKAVQAASPIAKGIKAKGKPGRPAKAKVAATADAPYGVKADGTPKKRPGRPAKVATVYAGKA